MKNRINTNDDKNRHKIISTEFWQVKVFHSALHSYCVTVSKLVWYKRYEESSNFSTFSFFQWNET